MQKTTLTIPLPDLAAVTALGQALLRVVRPGTVLTLSGVIGSGKTTLARSLIRAAVGEEVEVPSPTFTLVQTYDTPSGITIWHFDLYRLSTHEEAFELGIEDAFTDGISLIEWPERLGPLWPPDRLDVIIVATGWNEERQAYLQGFGLWKNRIGCIIRAMTEMQA
ncbi:TsaE protein, required for threonylcarbamoyladenosine t(6)A37 formation in tRNA [invertebrate metagenome]|uniref:tRNA threonylcarbamoyladenosine biosynthesis protein TsaE n=1 Tax=invertebrate metagenome TaxID=1711999 RepID=A0A484HDE3_9ZZZZ